MTKTAFDIQGSYPAPFITVSLDISGNDLELAHAISLDVQQVIGNRLRAMAQRHKHETRVNQEAQERELARQMEIRALEDRLAELKEPDGKGASRTALFPLAGAQAQSADMAADLIPPNRTEGTPL